MGKLQLPALLGKCLYSLQLRMMEWRLARRLLHISTATGSCQTSRCGTRIGARVLTTRPSKVLYARTNCATRRCRTPRQPPQNCFRKGEYWDGFTDAWNLARARSGADRFSQIRAIRK